MIQFGATPSEGSGAWGTFASAVTGAAQAVGPGIVLAALKQGEEHGLVQYQAALENPDVHPDCQLFIRTQLVPDCRQHVVELDRLIGGMDK